MTAFVITAVFPDYQSETNNVNIEEADMDGNESSEEKKETKEDKENLHHGMGSIELAFELEHILKHPEHAPLLLELYLPVITPPPDSVA